MTENQNPFGEAGFDMNALLQQAQQMQEQMMSAQQELAETTVDGTVGDEERPGDSMVRASFGHEGQDFALPRGEG